jgi:energy-coupling factor transport system permease protein
MVSIFLIPSSLNNIYYLLGFLGLFLAILLICRINLLAVINGIKPIMFIGLFTFVLQIIYNQEGTLIVPVTFNISWLTILISVGLIVIWSLTKKLIPLKTTYTLLILSLILFSVIFIVNPIAFWTPTINVYDYGLVKGTFFLLRIILVVMLSTLLTISTSTIEINLGLEWVLGPLKYIKVPVAEIAMMFSLTLRFIPTLLIETNKIMKAQASRGIDFNEGNFVEKVKQIVTLLIPMFFISITRAEDLANPMEARGYVIGEPRTNIDELEFQSRDFISFVVVLLILAATIVLQVVS